ncbi:MAG: response regulator transcription factor [Chloroflexota bacterium]
MIIREGEKAVTKILVVDDHPVFRQGLVSVLEEWPELQLVGQAVNATEAVSMAMELQPDIVITDIRMPDGNGVEATAALQQKLPQIKVLILTVSDEDDDLFSAIEAGARGYLLKSSDLDGLISAIRVVAAGDVIITPTMAVKLMNELRQGNKHRNNEELNVLSPRERQVTQLVATGASNKEIAAGLSISETTVKAHLRSILEKLHVKNRAQAAAKAVSKGLLD